MAHVPGLERSASTEDDSPFLPMSLSADGDHFAYGLDEAPVPYGADRIRVWDTRRNRQVTTLTAGNSPFLGVAVSPDGRAVMTTAGGSGAKVWDTRSGKRLRSLPEPNRGNGSELLQSIGALGADGMKLLTDASGLNRVSEGKTRPDALGECDTCLFAFCPDARRIAAAND